MPGFVPEIKGTLRSHMLHVPESAWKASGIKIFGRLIRTIVFSTDVSIIRNIDADAVIAVYPFTPQPVITQAIMTATDKPVFCGIGGGITGGKRVVNLGLHAEFQGAIGVVVNAPTTNKTIELLAKTVDIPVVVTVVSDGEDIDSRLAAGASILNVSGGANTAEIVSNIRRRYPELPIIATGGPDDETIESTIEAGANAITWTPPTTAEIFGGIMERYRKQAKGEANG